MKKYKIFNVSRYKNIFKIEKKVILATTIANNNGKYYEKKRLIFINKICISQKANIYKFKMVNKFIEMLEI